MPLSAIKEYRTGGPESPVRALYAETPAVRPRLDALRRLLSPGEILAAGRFHFREDAESYILAHALARLCCAGQTGEAPEDLDLRHRPGGSPYLVSRNSGGIYSISLAHCRAACAAAFPAGGEAGIDVERTAPLPDYLGLAERYFHPQEAAYCRAAEDSLTAFYTCWTQKEAVVKATGEGLSRSLDSFITPRADEGSVLPSGKESDLPPLRCVTLRPRHDIALSMAWRTDYPPAFLRPDGQAGNLRTDESCERKKTPGKKDIIC